MSASYAKAEYRPQAPVTRPTLADYRSQSAYSVRSTTHLMTPDPQDRPRSAMSTRSFQSYRSAAPSYRTHAPSRAATPEPSRPVSPATTTYMSQGSSRSPSPASIRVGTPVQLHMVRPEPWRQPPPRLSIPESPPDAGGATSLRRGNTVVSDVWVPPDISRLGTPSHGDYPPARIEVPPPAMEEVAPVSLTRRVGRMVVPVLCACVSIGIVVGFGYGVAMKVREARG